jgi:hypothetical protein
MKETEVRETTKTSKREWTSMSLVSVGRLGDLMQGGGASTIDGGTNKKMS